MISLTSRNTVRVGAARFVITVMMPAFSAMNKRLVSSSGAAMATGHSNWSPGKIGSVIYPEVFSVAGNASAGLLVRIRQFAARNGQICRRTETAKIKRDKTLATREFYQKKTHRHGFF